MRRLVFLLAALLVGGLAEAESYVGVSGALLLPQGGARPERCGGALVRLGHCLTDTFALEGEAALLERSLGFGVNGLVHWQALPLYDKYFGFSPFDPFFTLGGRCYAEKGEGPAGPVAGVGAYYHLTNDWSLRADADLTLDVDGEAAVYARVGLGVVYDF